MAIDPAVLPTLEQVTDGFYTNEVKSMLLTKNPEGRFTACFNDRFSDSADTLAGAIIAGWLAHESGKVIFLRQERKNLADQIAAMQARLDAMPDPGPEPEPTPTPEE